MEKLEIRLRNSERNEVPYELFTMSSQLQHLILDDCGMVWDSKLVDFRNLRSLQVVNLYQQSAPSLHQLLTVLRQMSCLESLHLDHSERRDAPTDLVDLSMLHDIEPVILGCLERITLIGDLSFCVLLNHIVLSHNVCSINLNVRDLREIPSLLAQALAEKFDNCVEGPTLSLSLCSRSIRCWKSKDTAQIPSFYDPPTINIGSPSTTLNEGESFWHSLCLDQLVSLEIHNPLGRSSWTVFGNLPKVRDLRVWSPPDEFLNVLHHGLVGKSTDDAQPVHTTFPALRNLTMLQCRLDSVANVEHNTSPVVSIVQLMLSCFELRKKAALPLESLKLEECTGVDGIQLGRLRVIIDRVDWIFEEYSLEHDYNFHDDDFDFGGPWSEDTETDEDFEPYFYEDYDYYDVD
ncbi:hypothetical protein C0993_011584 [Termitomyces sp. T159_Od127]|nr:hypothetical protein C0993_011584 [Termitomyces sp. T159_Od127]